MADPLVVVVSDASTPVILSTLLDVDLRSYTKGEVGVFQPAKAEIPRRAVSQTFTLKLDEKTKLSEGTTILLRQLASTDGGFLWQTVVEAIWTSYGPKGLTVLRRDGSTSINPDPSLTVFLAKRVGHLLRAEVIFKGEVDGSFIDIGATVTQASKAPIKVSR